MTGRPPSPSSLEADPVDEIVVWHDVECGGYGADLPLWRQLAVEHGAPILDVGAGTGRVALHLARLGHEVVALDREPKLLAALSWRAGDLAVRTIAADARSFELGLRFALILVPMQTIQLLDGDSERAGFLAAARRHLEPKGVMAVAITETLELYEIGPGMPAPLPDMLELEGVLYSSQPTAIRTYEDGYRLERRRERVSSDGRRRLQEDRVHIAALDAGRLEAEAQRQGLSPLGRRQVPATIDHVGSTVVILGA